MKRSWVEISCDYCGCADHYRPGNADAQARGNGWIITRDGKCYCDKTCYSKGRKKESASVR